MRSFVSVSDPVFVQPAQYSIVDNVFLKLIQDERDLPFIYLTIQITLFMLPLGILLYFPLANWMWWSVAAFYFYLNNFFFKGPFGLMLHCTSHRRFFKKEYDYLNHYLPWVIGPFFGQTPETYFSHHLGMHHIENNLEDDLSSTMAYQRDSFRGFMSYFANFLFLGLLELVKYFDFRNLFKLRNKVIRGEVLFFVGCGLLCWLNWQATLVVFILPFVISRFIMMLGNWAQHSFVDYEDPGNHYKNSITCINTSYNKKCWNDGYHINHHVKPALHWTLYPSHFEQNLNEFSKNKALVFEGIHFLHIWWYLMKQNYTKLAAHIVNINNAYASEAEVIQIMKSRTLKMPKRGISAKSLKQKAA
jgi:fatty acid desaturase